MTPERQCNKEQKEEIKGVREIFESHVAERATYLINPILERQKKELQECQLRCQKYAFLETVTDFYGQLTSRPVRVEHGQRVKYSLDKGINEFRQIGTDSQPYYFVDLDEFIENNTQKYRLLFYKVLDQDKWGMPLVEGIDTDDICVREDILSKLEKTIVQGRR